MQDEDLHLKVKKVLRPHQVRQMLLHRAVKISHARQDSIGWMFVLCFLFYPLICMNIFAMFHW
jgi:hypothetical protein